METNTRAPDGPSATFSPSDALLWEVLPHLQLNIAQTAALCGVSVRQLGYWTKQGYVAAAGQGARRMYGLVSLRRILAVRNAMTNGASLRQALKAQPESADTLASPALPSDPPGATPEDVRPVRSSLSLQEAGGLAADLLALFAANRQTRDDAAGLAVKVGRSATDILSVAETLCAHGVLTKVYSQDLAVFQSARKDGV